MSQPEPTFRPGMLTALAATTMAAISAVTIALPSTTALADPVPPPPPPSTAAPAAPAPPPPADPNAPPAPPAPPAPAAPAADTPAPAPAPAPPADPNAPAPAPASPAPAPGAPAPADPNAPAPAPAPADPNAPAPAPAPADPNAPAPAPAPAPDAGRTNNAAGGFSYIVPAGWEVADASRLSYGQALLLKQTGTGIGSQTANDTSILLGRLDLKLFAGAEADNAKSAVRLASDMGEFFMPFPGSRINSQSGALQAGDMPGAFSTYDVKFTDTTKPNGQIWAGVVGTANANRSQPSNRWFVVWLGTAKDPIDSVAAKALAQSIRPYTAPALPAAPAPDPNAPAAPPAPGNRVGVPIPVETPVPEMMPAG